MFAIDVKNMYWKTEGDDTNDLCAHGEMTVVIGSETFQYDGTVSSTAIYLLKTLTENHMVGEDNQMMPHCGHFMIANDSLDNVHIFGCDSGVDWEVRHIGNKIKIVTESGKETVVDFETYKEVVINFADKVETFYNSCLEKILPDDELQRNGYTAFWNEWKRRRYGK